MKRSAADTGLKLLSTVLAGKSQAVQGIANTAAQVVANLALRAYNRFEEREADLYATHIAFNSGYNPTYLSSMLLRMYTASPGTTAKFLSRHPTDPERVDYLTTYLEAFPLEKEMQIDSAEFQQMKQGLGSLVPAGKRKSATPVLKP